MGKMKFRRVVPVVALLALAACTGDGGDTPLPPPATSPGAAVPSSAAGPTAAPPRSPVATPPPTRATTRPGTPESTSTAFRGLELAKTGGFAGVDQSVSIKADGSWQRLDGRQVTVTGKLGAGQLSELSRLVAAPQLARDANRKLSPNRCADAFAYVLKVNDQLIRDTQCDAADRPQQTIKIITFVERATSG